jgi:opacity protein-like surface antigen
MRNLAISLLLLLAVSAPVSAQQWSAGVATGPFVFGDFLERSLRPGNETGSEEPGTLTLSAATRAGLSVDIERSFSERFAMRVEGTFTRAPLAIKGSEDSGVEIDAGDLDVTTIMVPLVFRINPRGAFRFHVHGGPALALYHLDARENSAGAEPAFEGTKQQWGVAFGGGVAWWLSDRFAVEGNLTDIVTSSPIDRDQLPDVPGIDVPRPHNVHTTVGVRWTF